MPQKRCGRLGTAADPVSDFAGSDIGPENSETNFDPQPVSWIVELLSQLPDADQEELLFLIDRGGLNRTQALLWVRVRVLRHQGLWSYPDAPIRRLRVPPQRAVRRREAAHAG